MNAKRTDRGLVGRDLSRVRMTSRRRIPLSAVVGLLIAGYLLTALRVEITELGYARGVAVKQEKNLEEELRVLKAQLEELRTPSRLGELAAEHGFRRADDVIDLSPIAVLAHASTLP